MRSASNSSDFSTVKVLRYTVNVLEQLAADTSFILHSLVL